MMQEWDIRPLAKLCTGCGKAFEDRQEYYTRLSDKEGNYLRSDFCSICWANEEKVDPGYSNWNGVFRIPPAEPDRKVRKEAAETILRELMERAEPASAEVIYILAIMLERQRVLAEQKVEDRPDGTRLVIFAHRKTGEVFLVPDPGIGVERLEIVQQQVMHLLAPDAPPRPGTAPANPPDTPPPAPVAGPAASAPVESAAPAVEPPASEPPAAEAPAVEAPAAEAPSAPSEAPAASPDDTAPGAVPPPAEEPPATGKRARRPRKPKISPPEGADGTGS
jgi:hypothetical protein